MVGLPDTRQGTDYTCGASCLQAICGYFGIGDPEEEDYASAMRIRSDVGAHPHNVIFGVEYYGLAYREKWPMDLVEVKRYVARGIPVMMMLQAWATDRRRRGKNWSYATEWRDGHWVVAIGYDRSGMYFEDPSLAAVRGFLAYAELMERWHDVGPYWIPPHERHMQRYGIAIWKNKDPRPGYLGRALHID